MPAPPLASRAPPVVAVPVPEAQAEAEAEETVPAFAPNCPPLAAFACASAVSAVSPRPGITIIPSSACASGTASHSAAASAHARAMRVPRPSFPRNARVIAVSSKPLIRFAF
ncbi:hypothetical protein BTE28158_05619 [Burkholderia territorii]|nr:hypothetical protein BTE28158_05619 [Burkholderia territorii]